MLKNLPMEALQLFANFKSMKMFSIILINNIHIPILDSEVPEVVEAITYKTPVIKVGEKFFAYHQFATILPKDEADFLEKMRLRERGFFKCRKYGVVHKLGDNCDCKDKGMIDPQIQGIDGSLLAIAEGAGIL